MLSLFKRRAPAPPPPPVVYEITPPLTALERDVVDRALDLNNIAAEQGGDIMDCSRALAALYAACNRLGAARREESYSYRVDLDALSRAMEGELCQ